MFKDTIKCANEFHVIIIIFKYGFARIISLSMQLAFFPYIISRSEYIVSYNVLLHSLCCASYKVGGPQI